MQMRTNIRDKTNIFKYALCKTIQGVPQPKNQFWINFQSIVRFIAKDGGDFAGSQRN
jgi:hypothetical protein